MQFIRRSHRESDFRFIRSSQWFVRCKTRTILKIWNSLRLMPCRHTQAMGGRNGLCAFLRNLSRPDTAEPSQEKMIWGRLQRRAYINLFIQAARPVGTASEVELSGASRKEERAVSSKNHRNFRKQYCESIQEYDFWVWVSCFRNLNVATVHHSSLVPRPIFA